MLNVSTINWKKKYEDKVAENRRLREILFDARIELKIYQHILEDSKDRNFSEVALTLRDVNFVSEQIAKTVKNIEEQTGLDDERNLYN